MSLIDYIFELEIQIDRAIQKVQDSKYYIQSDINKYFKLLDDALKIFKFCEREGESRSITNIEKKAHILYLRTLLIKQDTLRVYNEYNTQKLVFQGFESIEKNITDLKQELENKIINSFNQDIKPKVEQIENTINENVDALSNINDAQSKNKENIDQVKSIIEEISQKIISEKSNIVNNLNEKKDQIIILLLKRLIHIQLKLT